MRSKLLLVGSVLPILLCAVPPGAASPAFTPTFETGTPAFKEKFKKAMADKKPAEMARLVKDDERDAELWILRACEVLADREDPDESAFFTAIHDAWKTAFKSEFPTRYREWLKALAKDGRKERKELIERWDKIRRDFEANKTAKDGFAFVQIIEETDQLAAFFEQVGDAWYSSEAWLVHAACFDEALRGESAEFDKAAKGLANAIKMRESIDCKDGAHAEALKRRAELVKKTADGADVAKGADPGKTPKGGDEVPPATADTLGPPLKVPLTFEPLASVEAFARPSWFADELFVIWNPVRVAGNGSSARFAHDEGSDERVVGAPKIFRAGAADLRPDLDGDGKVDGKGEDKIPLTNTGAPIRMPIGKGDAARPWAFFAWLGGDQETYQGVTTNFNATKELLTLYVISAASVTGTLAGVPLRFIDDSMDGNYGITDKDKEPLRFGYIGMTANSFHPELDSIVVGTSKRARPWSELSEIGGKWYRLEGGYAGKELTATPTAPELGTLVLDFKGPTPPSWVVVRGTGPLAMCFYDLAEAGSKGVSVPVGRYQLFYGDLRKGKKRQVQKSLMVPGKAAINYDVKRGGSTTVSLGAPFKFEFTTQKTDDGKVLVKGETVCVIGSAGERYERLWNCVAKPEVSVRKKGQKTGGKPVRMPFVMDTAMLEKFGWPAAWFPLDLAVETREKPDVEVEVQLVDKKHDLFGKVESDWKE